MDAAVFAVGAYDAVYLFKTVIERDGADPNKIRDGLENVPEFKGLVKHFKRPVFTRDRHNAVTEEDMVMTRWTNGKMLEIKYDDKGPYVETRRADQEAPRQGEPEAAVRTSDEGRARAYAAPVRLLRSCASPGAPTFGLIRRACISSSRSR